MADDGKERQRKKSGKHREKTHKSNGHRDRKKSSGKHHRSEGHRSEGRRGSQAQDDGIRSWEIKPEEIKLRKSIGRGVFGEVFKGSWRGTTVAVKKILDSRADKRAISEFRAEIDIMSKLRHPNLCLFMGACTRDESNLMIVTEFLPRGNLFQLLHNSKETITSLQKIKMALDVARAMAYLHSNDPPIMHRDLKTLNLLIDDGGNTKVCDFGMTKALDAGKAQTVCGTTQWMAPEILRNEPYGPKADVFSYGIILWEILCRRPPYFGVDPMVVARKVLQQGFRPEIPNGTSPVFTKLIRDAWADDPSVRPEFEDIVETLEELLEAVQSRK